MKSNKPQDATVHFTRALELAKTDKKITSDRVLAVEFALARNQYLAGDIAKAVQTAEAIARSHPADTITAPLPPLSPSTQPSAGLRTPRMLRQKPPPRRISPESPITSSKPGPAAPKQTTLDWLSVKCSCSIID